MAVNIDEIAALIRRTRKMAGLNQQELAELADVGKTLIFDLEKGHSEVSFAKLLRVLKVLNIKLELNVPQQILIQDLSRALATTEGEKPAATNSKRKGRKRA